MVYSNFYCILTLAFNHHLIMTVKGWGQSDLLGQIFCSKVTEFSHVALNANEKYCPRFFFLLLCF